MMLRADQDLPAGGHHSIFTGAGAQSPGGGDDGGRSGTAIVTKPKTRTKRPNLYRVLLLNDDYTPMEFVVHVLEQFFNKDREGATRIMLHVHQNGVGECGVFTYEVAETESDSGDGLRPQAPASAAMCNGKELAETSSH